MIKFKIDGVDKLVGDLIKLGVIPEPVIDAALKETATPLVNQLKSAYSKHDKTGALSNSISIYKRKRNGKSDPWFTYYIGPQYSARVKGEKSIGAGAAHMLEYGTVERFSANKKAGGVTLGKGRTYGAKIARGKLMPVGIVRRFVDINSGTVKNRLNNVIVESIMNYAKTQGFK